MSESVPKAVRRAATDLPAEVDGYPYLSAGNEKVLAAVFIAGWIGLIGLGMGEFAFGLEPTSGSDAFPGP